STYFPTRRSSDLDLSLKPNAGFSSYLHPKIRIFFLKYIIVIRILASVTCHFAKNVTQEFERHIHRHRNRAVHYKFSALSLLVQPNHKSSGHSHSLKRHVLLIVSSVLLTVQQMGAPLESLALKHSLNTYTYDENLVAQLHLSLL